MNGPFAKKVSCRSCGKELWRKFPRKIGSVCALCSNSAYRLKHYKTPGIPAVFRKDGDPLVHQVNCLDCGVALERRTYWRKPRCKECSRKRSNQVIYQRWRKRTYEARWFRLIFAASGYDTPEELLEAVKVRNPKTWAFRYDMTMERKRRSA